MPKPRPAISRFLAKLDAELTPAACWEWRGGRLPGGYGQFYSGGRNMLAHRWSYEHHHGPIPAGMEIDHTCGNPPCVNPAHLEAVTHDENMRRAVERKTHCVNGHEYTEANTYRHPNGVWRDCRKCISLRAMAYKARRRAA